jgi:hypothetical protein
MHCANASPWAARGCKFFSAGGEIPRLWMALEMGKNTLPVVHRFYLPDGGRVDNVI